MKTEALKLADYVEAREINNPHLKEASAMIRRLVEELDKLKEIDGVFDYYCDENIRSKQTKPLSDEEIGDCVDDYFGLMALQHKYIYDIDQVQEYGLKLAREILRKAQEK